MLEKMTEEEMHKMFHRQISSESTAWETLANVTKCL